MGTGRTGKRLQIDLSLQRAWSEEIPEQDSDSGVGGRALNATFLLEQSPLPCHLLLRSLLLPLPLGPWPAPPPPAPGGPASPLSPLLRTLPDTCMSACPDTGALNSSSPVSTNALSRDEESTRFTSGSTANKVRFEDARGSGVKTPLKPRSPPGGERGQRCRGPLHRSRR